MTWLVFSYSLLSQLRSSARVELWRRLQRLGAVVLKNGLYVLPDREDCKEAFQWLAQEVQQAKGDAIVMSVDRFESMSDSELIKLFHNACKKKYEQLDQLITALEKSLHARSQRKSLLLISKKLMKLEQEYEDVTRLDFFDSPYGVHVASRLRHLKQSLSQENPAIKTVPAAALTAYRDRRWVTRPRPHVDRLACAWLIRRFIDPTAVIRYCAQPDPDEVRFDMRGAEFGHEGNRCTFETMLLRFGLSDPALQAIAEIVHEIDLRDGRYARPEVAGLDVILKGWLLEKLSDQELESHGVTLFQAMYAALSRRSQQADRCPTRRDGKEHQMRSNRHDWSRFIVMGIVTLVTFSGFPIPTMAQQGDVSPPTKEELLPPHEITLTFDSFERGRVPPGFSTALTGGGGSVSWVIQEDPTAPTGGTVLAQASADQTDYRFPVCVYDKFTVKDVEVSVKFKTVSGTVDQAAGLVARFKDKDNYYVVRANALEDNVRLYKVVGGSRKQLAGANVNVPHGEWHSLTLAIKGRHMEVRFDGTLLLKANDEAFEEAGKVGLWTKADSVTYFDDLRVRPLQ